MKKTLSTFVALGLAVGFAATASALDVPHEVGPPTGYDRSKDTPTAPGVDLFSVKGSYSLVGAYQSDGMGIPDGVAVSNAMGANNGGDAFYFHTFNTNWVMNIGDKISVKSNMRFADRDVWGMSGTPSATFEDQDLNRDGGRQLDVREIYMEYDSPIGKWRMGRVPVAAWYGNFINSGWQGNRLMWWPNFVPKPFSVLLFTQKSSETDATNTASDQDTDGYYAGIEHKADYGTTAVAWWYVRNAVANANTADPLDQNDIWLFGKYKLANFTIEAEASFDFGDNTNVAGANEADRDALAAMVDVTGNFGPLSVGALYFYASGDDNPLDGDNEAFMHLNDGTGDDFNPYHILTGDYMGLLNQDGGNAGPGASNAYRTYGMGRAGVQSIGLKASYAVTPKLTLSGAIGAAWADKEQVANQDDEYGIEYDLNASYKLLNNLTYGVHFGFLDTGDFFQAGNPAVETNDITFLAHQITMNF